MSAIFLEHSDGIRLAAFFSVLFVMALWEALSPRRIQINRRLLR